MEELQNITEIIPAEELPEVRSPAGETTVPVEEKSESGASECAPLPPREEDTAALERELAELRRENLQRRLLEEASAQLAERGIDPAFAAFVLGEDSAATRRRVEQFDRQLAAALRQQLAARLPKHEPRDFAVVRPPRRARGIRRL